MIVDLFAGPGGWDQGVLPLGMATLGIEWDLDACATARAAGHLRLQADIAQLDPGDFGPLDGLMASPPCQGFSMAGHGRGRADSDLIMGAVAEMAAGRGSRADLVGRLSDQRSLLVLEPLRWALELRPEWMAWEQVPVVQPLWEECAEALRHDGYSVWTGNVQAEQYGVPQTRKRAILVASRNHRVRRPVPTHSRFYVREPRRLDVGVQKWTAMEDVLERRGYRYVSTPMANSARRAMHEPAPTVMRGHETPRWRAEKGDHEERVCPRDMSILQSFPADYPWQGAKTSQYHQIGNAVPPTLAMCVVEAAA